MTVKYANCYCKMVSYFVIHGFMHEHVPRYVLDE